MNDDECILDDGPGCGSDRRVVTPVRRPPTKRRAVTGDMYTHDDEPSTKKAIVDEPDDDVDIGNLTSNAGPSRLPSSSLMMGGDPKPAEQIEDPEATRLRSEDELILSKAILGHSLHEVYSNQRIQLAVCRNSMERINQQLSSADV